MAGANEREDGSADGGEEKAKAAPPEKGSYPEFLTKLRHPSSQKVAAEVAHFVNNFPGTLTRLQAAQRVHDFLAVTTAKLLLLPAFAEDASEEARIDVQEGLEKFVLLKLHKVKGYMNWHADIEQDEIVDKRLQEKLEDSAGLGSLGPDLTQEAQDNFRRAAAELRKVDQYKIPRDKVICMLNAYRLVDGVVWELGNGQSPRRSGYPDDVAVEATPQSGDGDVLHRVLEALVTEASPPNLFSNVEFAAAYRHPPRLTAEERRCLRDFSAALGAATGCTPKVPTTAIGADGSWTWSGFEELPPWLEGTGVSFRFEAAEAGNLLIGEVDELLGAYHRMASVLRTLGESPPPAK